MHVIKQIDEPLKGQFFLDFLMCEIKSVPCSNIKDSWHCQIIDNPKLV